ncbi:MAG: hypothetical protein NT002_13965 [candidate division Zixibacteria bacterium]|nr:hypothetical protein [candidate division Zixibacteria bacterium]
MSGNSEGSKQNLFWLIYLALIISGVLLMADAIHWHALTRLTVRLGVALIFTAIALFAGKDKPIGIISIGIVWLAVVITLFS